MAMKANDTKILVYSTQCNNSQWHQNKQANYRGNLPQILPCKIGQNKNHDHC